ncbi:MAG: transcriptional regulator [Spirochaetes bacterium]|nr:transcriptional regulator [Spirochaetota bacterium]
MSTKLEEVSRIWPLIDNILTPPHNEEQYEQLVAFLDEVTDIVGEDESHPLSSLMETLGTLIEAYEIQNISEIKGSPNRVLQLLMEEHNLKQLDLPEVGSQGVVSEILSGKRKLNIRQMKALSERFGISPAVFM